MIFNKPINEIIEDRHSVRTYAPKKIPLEELAAIKQYIQEVTRESGEDIRIAWIEKQTGEEKLKLGTYGVIKGANYFLVAACKKQEALYVKLGYVLEKIVLFCTSLGLGTVWLGGTFSKSQFAETVKLEKDEQIMIVVPVGYEAEKKSMVAKLMGDHHQQRKAFETLFFEGDEKTPLTREAAGNYKEALEMLRLAPSAVNRQPWRVIKVGDTLHFYIASTKTLHQIDLGIALAHFHLTLMEQDISGEFVQQDPKLQTSLAYRCSWITQMK